MKRNFGNFSKYSKVIVSATLSTSIVFSFGLFSNSIQQVEASNTYIASDTKQASQAENNTTEKGKVTAVSGLNFRKGPSTETERYSVLPFNTVIEILEKVDEEWLKVKHSEQIGYVSAEFIKVIDPNAAPSAESTDELIEQIIETGHTYVGTPYKYAATSGSGYFDCSLFTQTVFAAHGIELARDSRSQYSNSTKIEKKDLRRGDLVFFSLSKPNEIGHVAIYLGEDKLLHATSSGVAVTEFEGSDYYSTRYMGTGRVIE